jgi:diacylglycerol kinase
MIQIKKCLSSFRYAYQGIRHCVQHENNFKVHSLAAIAVVLLGAWAKLSRWEWCVLFLTIGLVLTAELMNSAIEKLTDLVSPGHNPKAGLVKDLAAGAVLVVAIVAVVVGIFLFWPHLEDVLSHS